MSRRFGQVRFEDVHLDDNAVLGTPGEAAPQVQKLLQTASVLLCADSVGGATEVLDRTVRYAKERFTFGRPIGSYQAIKHKLADMLLWNECAKAATRWAALAVNEGDESSARAVSIAKAYVGEAYSKLTSESIQIHGGIGFSWEHDCHLFMRRAKANEVLFGSPAWHRERHSCTHRVGLARPGRRRNYCLGSLGSPRTRSDRTFRMISDEPPAIVYVRA